MNRPPSKLSNPPEHIWEPFQGDPALTYCQGDTLIEVAISPWGSRELYQTYRRSDVAKKTAAWVLLEKEYSPGQMRILRKLNKNGLRGATLVPSAEAADAHPETLAKIPLPE